MVANSVTDAPDIDAVATRNGSEIDVLVWNYHDADVTVPNAGVVLAVDGLHGKAVATAEYRMDASHSNAYRAWQQMGSPEQLSEEQKRQLEKAGALEQTVSGYSLRCRMEGATWTISPAPRQGVLLVRLQEH